MIKLIITFALILSFFLTAGYAADDINLQCHVNVPDEFKHDPEGWIPPNGETESTRYTISFEAFWWNCVFVKSQGLENRCPFTCSGTPGATYGCSDGATDAEKQIKQILINHDPKEVLEYLKSFSNDSVGLLKIERYFPDGPKTENVNE